VQEVEEPEFKVNCVVLFPEKEPPVCIQSVPTFEQFTAAPAEFVPETTILSNQEPNPSSFISKREKSTGPTTAGLKVMVTVMVFVAFEVQSV
jgi:hypothetical protein